MVHHFCYLNFVFSENSTSTDNRMINNTLTSVPNEGKSYSQENHSPLADIGDSFVYLFDSYLYEHCFSSDISKCYLRILVDKLTSMLRLMIWYEDPINVTGMIIYSCYTMDFGDGISSIVVKITQFLGTMCALSETKRIVTYTAYADNYASSFQEGKTYQDVQKGHAGSS